MKTRKTITLFALLFLPVLLFSQGNNFWNASVTEPARNQQLESFTTLTKSKTFGLNVTALKNEMAQAPLRGSNTESQVVLAFPLASGNFKNFTLYKTQTMSPGLAEKFPTISSFVGISSDKTQTLRLTTTSRGIFGMILGLEETVIINPLTATGTVYQVFNDSNAYRSVGLMQCLYENTEMFPENENAPTQKFTNDGKLRTYELALAATGEYSQYHIALAGLGGGTPAQQTAAVMAAMVVTMDRVNGVYERDLAITMSMVTNNDQLIYLNGATDPYTNNDGFTMLGENQANIDAVIGNANYDIGHVFSTGGGGIAATPSVCNNPHKAKGVTGLSAPIGDIFAIDYVCHEMGHQFGANHTQNNACQRNDATAVEPGSGSTIMGYAGICPPNVQGNSDDYFHTVSLDEIISNLNFGLTGTCPTETTIANTEPTVTPIPDYSIPYGTAFVLTGNATDPEGDALTYTWEQTDNQVATMPPVSTSTGGPTFRSLEPTASPKRYFPNLTSILAGDLAPTWEVIPTVARTLNFTLTVRDNNVLGGQTTTDDIVVNVVNMGPFLVTSQNVAGLQFDQYEAITVSWNLPGFTSNVDVLLSYDGGLTYPTVVASNVFNDGSETLYIPGGTASTTCRLMVKGSGSIFFDVNDENFEITNQALADYVYDNGSWTPTDPSGVSTATDNVLVIDGFPTLTANTEMNNLTVNQNEGILFEGVLTVNGDIVNDGQIGFLNYNSFTHGQLNDMTGSTISGSGDFIVQRRIPARDDGKGAYRYITSAVNSTGSINSDWQEGATDISQDPTPGAGMFITGVGGSANGFDQTTANAPSMFTFNEGTQAYVGIPNTNVDQLVAGLPYSAYVWGDRSVDIITNNDPVATSTTLNAQGNLVIGNHSSSGSSVAGAFNLFGNPYQAIVDMNDVFANAGTANVNTNIYYVWDANLGTRGAYATVSLPTGSPTPGTSAANQYLQPGQAAWAVSTGGASTIAFEESDKDVFQTPTDVFRPQNMASIELQLFQTTRFANGQTLSDATWVNFTPDGNNAVTLNDAPKLTNRDENLALVNGTEHFAIENRAMPIDGEVLQLYNSQYRVSDYTFKAIVDNLPDNTTAYLKDAYLDTQTPLNNNGPTLIPFSVDASMPASIAPDRFSIVFAVNGLSTEDFAGNGFVLYPNPVKEGGFFILTSGISGEKVQVTLYSLLGQQVFQTERVVGANGRISVQEPGLKTGVYLVKMEHNPSTGLGQVQSFVEKLIVQ